MYFGSGAVGGVEKIQKDRDMIFLVSMYRHPALLSQGGVFVNPSPL